MPDTTVIITAQDWTKRRKYVVLGENAQPLRALLSAAGATKLRGAALQAHAPLDLWIGARWYRRTGVVDEMHRTLSVSIPLEDERTSGMQLLSVELRPDAEVWAS